MIFYKTGVIIGAELLEKSSGAIAQLVEQMTFNHWVQGSSPCGPTKNQNRPCVGFCFWSGKTRREPKRVRHDSWQERATRSSRLTSGRGPNIANVGDVQSLWPHQKLKPTLCRFLFCVDSACVLLFKNVSSV